MTSLVTFRPSTPFTSAPSMTVQVPAGGLTVGTGRSAVALHVSGVRDDVVAAARLVQQSMDTIRTVPTSDTGSEGTKAARIAAFHLNLDAQALLEPHFTGTDAGTLSLLRTADASLEDAAWQLAKKPSPDGRFNGVDIPGALRDSQAALDALTRVTR